MRHVCPDCSSRDVTNRTSLQHDDCGYIRPEEVFAGADGERPRCPQCEQCVSESDLSAVGKFSVCQNCCRRFDTHQLSEAVDEVGGAKHDQTEKRTLGSPASSSGDKSVTRNNSTRLLLWFGVILAIGLIVITGTAFDLGTPLLASAGGDEGEDKTNVGANVGPTGGPLNQTDAATGWGVPAETNYRPPEPGVYDTIVVFRNDDVQSSYHPSALQNVTELFLEEGVPLTHSVLGNTRPNASVCGYLRVLNAQHDRQFEVALHGFSHENQLTESNNETPFQLSEFAGLDVGAQRQLIQRGTENVTQCTGERPTTFVPPFDTYDGATVHTLNESGYEVVSGATWHFGENATVFARGGVIHVGYVNDRDLTQLYYNYTASTPNHNSVEAMNRSLDSAITTHSPFLFTIHYQHFTSESALNRQRSFLEYTRSKDVAFMTVGQFSDALRDGRLQRVDEGWKLSATADGGATATNTPTAGAPVGSAVGPHRTLAGPRADALSERRACGPSGVTARAGGSRTHLRHLDGGLVHK